MEAEHFAESTQGSNTRWTVIPDLGRTLSGLALMPYDKPVEGASLTYRMNIKTESRGVRLRLILDSTLPFIKEDIAMLLVWTTEKNRLSTIIQI